MDPPDRFDLAVSALIVFERGVTLVQPSFLLPLLFFRGFWWFRHDRSVSAKPRENDESIVYIAVARATGAIVLILIVSAVLVNVLFPGYGHPIVPDAEASCWAFVLSLTAATSAAASLALLVSHISLNAAKWGFRVMILAVVLIYKVFLGAWTVSWYNLVDEWGFTLVALRWWLLLRFHRRDSPCFA